MWLVSDYSDGMWLNLNLRQSLLDNAPIPKFYRVACANLIKNWYENSENRSQVFCKYSYYLVTSLLLANAINPQDINDYGCLIAHLVLSTYKGCMTSKL